jgi:hypothetical protein
LPSGSFAAQVETKSSSWFTNKGWCHSHKKINAGRGKLLLVTNNIPALTANGVWFTGCVDDPETVDPHDICPLDSD